VSRTVIAPVARSGSSTIVGAIATVAGAAASHESTSCRLGDSVAQLAAAAVHPKSSRQTLAFVLCRMKASRNVDDGVAFPRCM
jgi:hypothetical protein